ncbi:hypothetical protein [Actinomadura nitritigenes]|uniref:hypothetical protein n=1 Tax=Actinomadura nitritigenes TaxID=134602 RepID=UPI003D8B42F1
MRWEDVVSCPPLVQLGTGRYMQPAYLLAWVGQERTREWLGIVSYPRVAGEPPAAHRGPAEVRGSPILPPEPPAAYADVPRLQLGADGVVGPWEKPPPSEP